MSSTVGYGVEVRNEEDADWDFWEMVEDKSEIFRVVRSRPEYTSDPEQTFLMVNSTVKVAGVNDNSVAFLPLNMPTEDEMESLNRITTSFPDNIQSEAGWYLVDYYTY